MDRNLIKEMIEIKDIIKTSEVRISDDDTDDIIKRLNDIEEKIDNLNFNKELPESPVKVKRKKEIVNLLLKHNKITATQLSYLTKISRTRCNEYLKELETSKTVKGNFIDKKKYYELI
jgi:DNA-binding transcriptional regulator GbsR (MarR family)